MLCQLNLAAASILRRQRGSPDHARDHIIRAVASKPHDLLPRRHLARLCAETARYQDAIDIIDGAVRHDPINAFELFGLGSDLEILGRPESVQSFQRARDRDAVGLITDLCRYRLERRGSTDGKTPSERTLNDYYKAASQHLLAGDHSASLKNFMLIATWLPNAPLVWCGIGYSYKKSAERITEYEASDASEKLPGDAGEIWSAVTVSPDSEEYFNLEKASYAFRICVRLDPSLAAAHNELALCELLLGRPFSALAAALQYQLLRPHEVVANANLSLAMLSTNDLNGAFMAASAALSIDPSDPIARVAMNRVVSRGGRTG
jgi:tetratricopeptide (TPR) repeat protein